jgi:hypothetical protein
MTYSSAIFPDLDSDLHGMTEERPWANDSGVCSSASSIVAEYDVHDPLEQAQLAKLRHIIKKAKIQPGHRVLEIGSGWGSFAIEVRTPSFGPVCVFRRRRHRGTYDTGRPHDRLHRGHPHPVRAAKGPGRGTDSEGWHEGKYHCASHGL